MSDRLDVFLHGRAGGLLAIDGPLRSPEEWLFYLRSLLILFQINIDANLRRCAQHEADVGKRPQTHVGFGGIWKRQRRSVPVRCCRRTALGVHGLVDRFAFTANHRQFRCFNAVTLSVTNPERLHLARLAALILCLDELSFPARKAVSLDRQAVAFKVLVLQVTDIGAGDL